MLLAWRPGDGTRHRGGGGYGTRHRGGGGGPGKEVGHLGRDGDPGWGWGRGGSGDGAVASPVEAAAARGHWSPGRRGVAGPLQPLPAGRPEAGGLGALQEAGGGGCRHGARANARGPAGPAGVVALGDLAPLPFRPHLPDLCSKAPPCLAAAQLMPVAAFAPVLF